MTTKVTTDLINTLDASKLTGTLPAISGASLTGITTGKVLQVISVHDATGRSQSVTSAQRVDISGLSASITPSATSSKILISARWNGENGDTNRTWDAVLGIRRDGTDLGLPSVSGSRSAGMAQVLSNPYQGNENTSTLEGAMFEYLDSPSSTSSLTYTITYRTSAGSTFTLYTNRGGSVADQAYVEYLTSSITLWEIGA